MSRLLKLLAANDDERDAVIQQRIDILQGSQQLDEVADELLAKLDQQSQATSADWYLAARFLEAARRWPLATEAIDKAILADSKSIPALNVAARIAETSGDYGRASKMNRTLAEIDRRSRGDHLMNVSRLEAQLGRADEALKAAQELIVSAPGNTDNYEFFAQVCLRFGRADEGLDALRKAVRINPNEPHLIMALAAALADQLRTDEAIEVYWRAFDKSDEVEDKVSLTMKLTLLYQQINQLDKLIDRLERERREVDKRREMTICLAQAWHTSGDLGAARQELEGLLSEDTRDTNLLNQLAKLCQEAADPDAAVAYQRQLVAIAPGHETEFPLAGMLMASGQTDEAREIFVKLTQREEDRCGKCEPWIH
ncbi:MAG: tetratricopeptide repeat protein [Pirellulaceae bacterium]